MKILIAILLFSYFEGNNFSKESPPNLFRRILIFINISNAICLFRSVSMFLAGEGVYEIDCKLSELEAGQKKVVPAWFAGISYEILIQKKWCIIDHLSVKLRRLADFCKSNKNKKDVVWFPHIKDIEVSIYNGKRYIAQKVWPNSEGKTSLGSSTYITFARLLFNTYPEDNDKFTVTMYIK